MSLHLKLNTKSLTLFPDIARRGRDVGSMASMFKLEDSGDDPLLAGPGVTAEGASTRTMQHAGGAYRRRLCSITIPSADSVAFQLQAILAPRATQCRGPAR